MCIYRVIHTYNRFIHICHIYIEIKHVYVCIYIYIYMYSFEIYRKDIYDLKRKQETINKHGYIYIYM